MSTPKFKQRIQMSVNETSPIFELEESDSYEDASLAKYLVTVVQRKDNAKLVFEAACRRNASAVRIIKSLVTSSSKSNEAAISLLETLK